MVTLILNGMLFVAALVSISNGIGFKEKSRDRVAASKYLVLCHVYAIYSIMSIISTVAKNQVLTYLIYSLIWFFWIIILAYMIDFVSYVTGYRNKMVSLFISFVYYIGVGGFFLKILLENQNPVFAWGYIPRNMYLIDLLLYIVMLIVYAFPIIVMCVKYAYQCKAQREKYLLKYLCLTFIPTLLGELLNLLVPLLFHVRLPISQLCCLIAIIVMSRLLRYYRSMVICREDYAEWLSADRTDSVLICDAEQRIIFVNKRAEITAQMMRESFSDRKLDEVFKISEEAKAELDNSMNRSTFGIDAVWSTSDRKVNIAVQRVRDRFDCPFVNIITILDLEDSMEIPTEEQRDSQKEKNDIENDISTETAAAIGITRDARALLVNDSIAKINVLEKMMQPYQMHVSRAIGEKTALTCVKEKVYDVIFIEHQIGQPEGLELAKSIRALDNEYYKKVPIIFCTSAAINDVYEEFLDAGFNDYLNIPISSKQLNLVLTRWVWKRYEKEDIVQSEEPEESAEHGIFDELDELLKDSMDFYEKEEYLLLGFCIKGIKQGCAIVEATELEELAREIENALLFEDLDVLEIKYEELTTKLKKILMKK